MTIYIAMLSVDGEVITKHVKVDVIENGEQKELYVPIIPLSNRERSKGLDAVDTLFDATMGRKTWRLKY